MLDYHHKVPPSSIRTTSKPKITKGHEGQLTLKQKEVSFCSQSGRMVGLHLVWMDAMDTQSTALDRTLHI